MVEILPQLASLHAALTAEKATTAELTAKCDTGKAEIASLTASLENAHSKSKALQSELDSRATESAETVAELRSTQESLVQQLSELNKDKTAITAKLSAEKQDLQSEIEKLKKLAEKEKKLFEQTVSEKEKQHIAILSTQEAQKEQIVKEKDAEIQVLKTALTKEKESNLQLEKQAVMKVETAIRETKEEMEGEYMKEIEQAQFQLNASKERREMLELQMELRETEFADQMEKMKAELLFKDEKTSEAWEKLAVAEKDRDTEIARMKEFEREKNDAVGKFEGQLAAFYEMRAKLEKYESKLLRNATLAVMERFPEVAKAGEEFLRAGGTSACAVPVVEKAKEVTAADGENEGDYGLSDNITREQNEIEIERRQEEDGILASLSVNAKLFKPHAELDIVLVGERVGKLALLERCIREAAPDQYSLFQYNRALLEQNAPGTATATTTFFYEIPTKRTGECVKYLRVLDVVTPLASGGGIAVGPVGSGSGSPGEQMLPEPPDTVMQTAFAKSQYVIAMYDFRNPMSMETALKRLKCAREEHLCQGLLMGNLEGFVDTNERGSNSAAASNGNLPSRSSALQDDEYDGVTYCDLFRAKSEAAKMDCMSVEAVSLGEAFRMLTRDYDFPLTESSKKGIAGPRADKGKAGCSGGGTTSSDVDAATAGDGTNGSDATMNGRMIPASAAPGSGATGSCTGSATAKAEDDDVILPVPESTYRSEYLYRRTVIELSQTTFLKPSVQEYGVTPETLDDRERTQGVVANLKVEKILASAPVAQPGVSPASGVCPTQEKHLAVQQVPLPTGSPLVLLAFAPESAGPLSGTSSSSTTTTTTASNILAAANDCGEILIYEIPHTTLETKQRELCELVKGGRKSFQGRAGAAVSPLDLISEGVGNDMKENAKTKSKEAAPQEGGFCGNKSATKPYLRRRWTAHKNSLVTALLFPPLRSGGVLSKSVASKLLSRRGQPLSARGPHFRGQSAHQPISKPRPSSPSHLFSAALNGEAKLWNIETGEVLVTYEDAHAICCAAFMKGAQAFSNAANNDLLVYANASPAMRLITTSTHQVIQKLKLETEIRCITFCEKNYFLCGGVNGCIYVIEAYSSTVGGGGGVGGGGSVVGGTSTRLRPMLVTFQYGAREITSLSVSEWHGADHAALRYCKGGTSTSVPPSSFATAATSTSRPTSTRLCLVNCVGSDVLGILQLSYKKDTLVMLNLVQTIANPNRYLPLQSLFCCGKFVVSATEEAPRVVKVHVVGNAKQGPLVDTGGGAVNSTFNILPNSAFSSCAGGGFGEQHEMIPTSQGMLHNGLSCQGNVISETRTLTFGRSFDGGRSVNADLFSSYGGSSCVSDPFHTGKEEVEVEVTSQSAEQSIPEMKENKVLGVASPSEEFDEATASARISIDDIVHNPVVRRGSPRPESIKSSPALSPAKSDVKSDYGEGKTGTLIKDSPGLRISQHNVDLSAVDRTAVLADNNATSSPIHRTKTNSTSRTSGAPATPPSVGKKSSHTSSAPSLSPRVSPRGNITKKIDNDPPAAYAAMVQTRNANGNKHTLSQPVLGARTTSTTSSGKGGGVEMPDEKAGSGGGDSHTSSALISPTATTATTTPVTVAAATPIDYSVGPAGDQLAKAVAEAKNLRRAKQEEAGNDTDDTSSISTMNADRDDRAAVDFELEENSDGNGMENDKEDEYGLCLAVNESFTLLAIGDTTGGLSLVRRTTCRRRPGGGVYSY